MHTHAPHREHGIPNTAIRSTHVTTAQIAENDQRNKQRMTQGNDDSTHMQSSARHSDCLDKDGFGGRQHRLDGGDCVLRCARCSPRQTKEAGARRPPILEVVALTTSSETSKGFAAEHSPVIGRRVNGSPADSLACRLSSLRAYTDDVFPRRTAVFPRLSRAVVSNV